MYMAGSGYLLKSTAIFDSVQDRTFSGFVAVQGNRIAGTGSDEETAGYWEEQGFEVIDCGDGLIIPGMIDAHMHFFDGIFQNSRLIVGGAGTDDEEQTGVLTGQNLFDLVDLFRLAGGHGGTERHKRLQMLC